MGRKWYDEIGIYSFTLGTRITAQRRPGAQENNEKQLIDGI